jgi:DNA helicase II / ATP-dependent DNA helicase PcrA
VKWTPQQEAVFEDVASGAGHTVVVARAGAAKTTTLIEAAKRLPVGTQALFLAFNKSIADELRGRLPSSVDVHTCHSFGLRVLRQVLPHAEVDSRKVWKAAAKYRGDRQKLCRAVSLAKAAGASADVAEIVQARGINTGHLGLQGFARAAAELREQSYATCRQSIDFDDMVWLPHVVECSVPQYGVVFVDETQDLSPVQVDLALHAAGGGGRVVAVGDDRQACYAFRGAGTDSLQHVQTRLDAKVLRLTVSFRCARAIITEAQRWVPDIEAAPGAPAGAVKAASMADMAQQAAEGDFILSRTNAPIVTLAWQLLAAGRRVSVIGRDFGAGVAALIRSQKAGTPSELLAKLGAWAAREAARGDEPEGLSDKLACAQALTRGAASIAEVLQRVSALFDGPSNGIRLSTTHRAKGLEADKVWVLSKSFLPSKRLSSRYSEMVQEQNLQYIAATRARAELIYV